MRVETYFQQIQEKIDASPQVDVYGGSETNIVESTAPTLATVLDEIALLIRLD